MRVACTEHAHEVSPGTLGRCPLCDSILRPDYPDEAVRQLAAIHPGPGIDRYRAVLPVSTALPSLGEGDTPLLLSRRIGPSLGLPVLFFKNEGRNPSGAFKDRAAALVTALASETGSAGVLTASSGNAASAIATYSAAAGLKCLILLERDAPPAKLRQALAMGAQVIAVDGLFARGPEAISGLVRDVAARLNYYPAFVWAPMNPYILEGIKTISYEIAARLPGAPDVVVCPVGGGDMLTAQWRGWLELKRAGLVEKTPRIIGVQSSYAPPLVEAFRAGTKRVTTLDYARSKISGVNVPFSGEHALAAIRESGGAAFGVPDEDVFAMQTRLAREEGLWVEPVGALPAAALAGLLESGHIAEGERVVCLLSGAGFKDSHLAEQDAQAVSRREMIPFEVEAVVAASSAGNR